MTASGRPATRSVSPRQRRALPGAAAGDSATASPSASGTMTECRAWKPSSRRPTTASVRFSLAGARRRTRAPAAAVTVAALIDGPSSPRRPRRGSAPTVPSRRPRRATSASGSGSRADPQRQPLPHRERLRPALAVDAARRQRRVHAPRPAAPAGAPARCGASCAARGSRPGPAARDPSSSVGREARTLAQRIDRHDLDHRRLDLGRRLERLARHHEGDRGRRRGTGRRPRGSSSRRARPRSARPLPAGPSGPGAPAAAPRPGSGAGSGW